MGDRQEIELKAIAKLALAFALSCAIASNARADITEVVEGRPEPFEQGASIRIPIDVRGELDAFELRNAAIDGFGTLARDANGRIAYRLEGFLLRRAGSAPSTALLVELDQTSDLAQIAVRRGLDVLSLAPAALAQPDALFHAALRDLVAHLRRAGPFMHVIAHGSGRQGRMLRRFTRTRDNRGETGSVRLFDGMLLHDAGEPTSSPLAERDAPLVIAIWSSGHVWRDTDALETSAEDEARSRKFYLAGAPEQNAGLSSTSTQCLAQANPLSIAPASRALFVALDEWVRRGAAPPVSRWPSVKDRSLVAVRDFRWPKLALPSPPLAGERPVPAIDVDGNEVGGLRLPDQAAPLGTYVGWNLRKERPDALCDGAGAFLPFAKSKTERERTGDPRLSLQERYGLRDYYVATVRVLADRLAKDRLLLREDADAYVAAAKKADF